MTKKEMAAQSAALEEFKLQIREKMLRLNMTCIDLAKLLGVSHATACVWVRSPERLTLSQLRRLNGILNLPGDQYLKAAGFLEVK